LVIARGDIWWADLPVPSGSQPGNRRPVLVLQADEFNRSRLQTIIVVGITANVKRAVAPGNVLLPANATGLPRDSVANISQILSVDRQFFRDRVGPMPASLLRQIEDGVRLILSI
jgi:mRNA interferase MazF